MWTGQDYTGLSRDRVIDMMRVLGSVNLDSEVEGYSEVTLLGFSTLNGCDSKG